MGKDINKSSSSLHDLSRFLQLRVRHATTVPSPPPTRLHRRKTPRRVRRFACPHLPRHHDSNTWSVRLGANKSQRCCLILPRFARHLKSTTRLPFLSLSETRATRLTLPCVCPGSTLPSLHITILSEPLHSLHTTTFSEPTSLTSSATSASVPSHKLTCHPTTRSGRTFSVLGRSSNVAPAESCAQTTTDAYWKGLDACKS